MTQQEERTFYGEAYDYLEQVLVQMEEALSLWRMQYRENLGRDPLLYTTWRIKSAASMQQKLMALQQLPTREAALSQVHDAAGIRAVCLFVDEVYHLAEAIGKKKGVWLLQQKDYITRPKANGYRSYHMILALPIAVNDEVRMTKVELQIRTVAMDTWAAMEHEIKYKQAVGAQKMLTEELKRCADEIASTELSMQTLRDLIDEEKREHICVY